MKLALQIKNVDLTILVYVEADHALEAGKWDGVLYALDSEHRWKANSGPHGKGPAPKGRYQVERPTVLAANEQTKPYVDKAGQAWFAQMTPLFQTERKGFGIHPDGNVPGTLGCIGITEPDTKSLLTFLQQTEVPIVLFVL